MAHTKVTKTHSQNTGAANTFSYSGSFDVFKATEVLVTLDGVSLTYQSGTINESASPRQYTVNISDKSIHIGGADLSSGTIVIRPSTDLGAPTARATYAAGSSITASDLNDNQTQLLRKVMELDENTMSATGATMTGNLTMGEDTTVIFEGGTDDGYETTLTVTDPTADRTITLPNVTGTVVTTGDTGTVATGMIAADAITGAKIADDALDSEHYTDGSIDAAHLAASSVTTAKIGSDAVTGAKIADDAIGAEHIQANAVGTSEISDAELVTLAGMQSGTASILAGGTALTATLSEINTVVDGKSVETTISDTDAAYPTSGAVVDYVAAQIAPIGGLEVIATDAAFPNTQPASGVVISIADAGGLVVNGSGTSTTGRTVGGSTVTINNINSSYNSSTVTAGIGFLVTSTGSSHTYNFHKSVIRDQDILSISTDIDDFANRYRVFAGEPSSNNDEGDLVYDTNADKMKVYDSSTSAWKEVTSSGDFKYLFLCPAGGSGSPTLDGSIATYDLRESSNSGSAASVTSAAQLIVSVNGVVQKPNTGTSAPSEGFALVDANTIIFGANLQSGDLVFIIQIGSSITISTPGDNTVATAKIQNLAVTTAKIAADAIDGTKLADNAVDSEHYTDGSIDHVHLANDAVDGDNIADDAVNSEHYVDGSIDTAHIADLQVTTAKIAADAITAAKIADDVVNSEHIAAGAVDLEHMSSESVDEDNLHISNAGSNGQYLQKQSGNAGGLTWATVTAQDTLSFRNFIVNGAMQISQRGTSFAAIANGAFSCDRWKWENNESAAATITQSSESPDGFGSSLKVDITTADTSLAAGGTVRLIYKIEGQDLQSLAKGTSSAKASVLSFYVKTNKTGVYTVMLYDNDNSRMWSGSYTVSDTNWNRYTLAIPADTTGAYGNDNASSLEMYFGLAIGTNRTSGSLASSWASYSAANEHVGQVNLADSTSNEFHITGVQYEVDSAGSGAATDFEHRSYADELARSQRYYVMIVNAYNQNICMAMHYGSSAAYGLYHMPVTMRDTPSIDVKNGTNYWNFMRDSSGDNFDTLALSSDTSARVARFNTTADISGTSGHAGWFMSWGSGSMSSADIYCALSAEL